MRMFITSKNKYLSNDMKIFGTCSIPLNIWYSQKGLMTINAMKSLIFFTGNNISVFFFLLLMYSVIADSVLSKVCAVSSQPSKSLFNQLDTWTTHNRVKSYPCQVLNTSSRNTFKSKLALILSHYCILYIVLTMKFQDNIYLMWKKGKLNIMHR